MRKYIGKYRVLIERGSEGNTLEFTYLTGKRIYPVCNIYRYNDEELTLTIMGKSAQVVNTIIKSLVEEGVQFTKMVDCGSECVLRFKEVDLFLVDKAVGIKTMGAKIVPESIKNHHSRKQIKLDKYNSLSDEEKLKRKQKGEILQQRLKAQKQ